ncbi:hypothetical protein CIG19_11240 [Enterobacterales bacterium CwR94]|nr:hypothetical protein CIG19_11240 [Enterobacterales bacterium CwR94]
MTLRSLLTVILFSASGYALADNPLCQQKVDDIQQQLKEAKAHNNDRKVNGLERALSQVQGSCTDAALQQAHAENIREKQKEVAERQQDLKEAQTKGDRDDIAKRQKKLDEEREELSTLQQQPY